MSYQVKHKNLAARYCYWHNQNNMGWPNLVLSSQHWLFIVLPLTTWMIKQVRSNHSKKKKRRHVRIKSSYVRANKQAPSEILRPGSWVPSSSLYDQSKLPPPPTPPWAWISTHPYRHPSKFCEPFLFLQMVYLQYIVSKYFPFSYINNIVLISDKKYIYIYISSVWSHDRWRAVETFLNHQLYMTSGHIILCKSIHVPQGIVNMFASYKSSHINQHKENHWILVSSILKMIYSAICIMF